MPRMEVNNAASGSGQISLNILQAIRSAQTQNGLKHGDYGRYRCVLRHVGHRAWRPTGAIAACARAQRHARTLLQCTRACPLPMASAAHVPQGVLRPPPQVAVQGPQVHAREGALPEAQAGGCHDHRLEVRAGARRSAALGGARLWLWLRLWLRLQKLLL